MSLGSLLSIARSALTVTQRSMEVTGHNIANANTPGYSRQTLQVMAATPLQLPMYSLGRGVDANQITRARDVFYDATYRQESGLLGHSSTKSGFLGQIEGALNEPSTNGLSAALDNMFGALSDLAGDPANKTNRNLVVANANRLVSQLHSLDAQMSSINQAGVDAMKTQVSQVNTLASEIADLNTKIIATGGPRGSSDLMDQRDMLVDQLSQFMDVRVMSRSDGSIGVVAGDTVLVDGAQAGTLAATPVGAGWGIIPAGGGGVIDPGSGSLKALTELTQTQIPGLRGQLDQVASALVTEFNRIHRAGYTQGGATNVDFFDPTKVTASTIDLSAALKGSSDNIAASGNVALGNGDIATQLAGLANTGVATLGGTTFREFFVSLASNVGLDASNTTQDVSAHQALVDRSDQARSAVSGVNVDEEMIALITAQQAYQAAARLVTVANQMVDTLMQVI